MGFGFGLQVGLGRGGGGVRFGKGLELWVLPRGAYI